MDTVHKGLFGTSGIRGDAEEFLTNQFCFDIGRAYANFLTKHKQYQSVAVGCDPRKSSPRIKNSIISGLVHEGVEVFDEGVVPIPAMNHILQVSSSYSGSIMITGSHIKPHLNGMKFFAFGEEILKDHEKEIEQIYQQLQNKANASTTGMDDIHKENRAKEEYQENLISFEHCSYLRFSPVSKMLMYG